jgi:hypothetical protein
MKFLFMCTENLIKIYALLCHCIDTIVLTGAPVMNHIHTLLNRIHFPICLSIDFNYVLSHAARQLDRIESLH